MNQSGKQVKWRSLIAEQKERGQSVAAFCRAREKRLREGASSQFVEVQVAKSQLKPKHFRTALGSSIEVRLRNGRSLMVPPEFEVSHLRALLAVVECES